MQTLRNFWKAIPWEEMASLSGKSLLLLPILAGIFMTPLGLPGTWLIALTALVYSFFGSFDGGASSPLFVNGVLIALALFGELMEFVVGVFGSKPFKVSNGAIACAFIGGIAGALIGVPVFLIGSMLGLFLGAFLGALAWEWVTLHSFGRAWLNATAVLATRMVAAFLKTTVAVAMGIYLLLKMF